MAHPVTIIGLVAGIANFIDFGIKAMSLARSAQGSVAEMQEFDLVVADVKARYDEVLRESPNARKLSETESHIISIATECQRLTTELRTLLETLKIRDGAWSRTVESSRVLLFTRKKKGEIENLWQRLERLDARLRDSVNQSLQRDQTSAISLELKELGQLQRDLGIHFDATLERIQTDILQLTEQRVFASEMPQLTRLRDCLNELEVERSQRRRQASIIQSLYFREIRRRWEQIPDADALSNAWLFDRTKTDFMDWLESGNGIYWITGKAGSGKSTLMKYASEHPETGLALTRWAQPAEPHYPNFFFWNQGFEMQKSRAGLLQSLIYQILSRAPGIIPEACPDRPNSHERWELQELKATLQRILNLPERCFPAKFCFFIDGLDEYGGDEEDLAQILDMFDKTPSVKLCVSSRPRPFLDGLYRSRCQTLVLHDFTKEDMRSHARQRLHKNKKFAELQRTSGPTCDKLLVEIADRAQGVWLWVYLVTHDLVHAINRDEGIETLQRIFHELPQDLEAYFESIINRVSRNFRKEMSQIFLLTAEEVQPLPLFAFSLLERERNEPNYAILAPASPLPDDHVKEVDKVWKSRLQNRCSDLLVVSDNTVHPTFLYNPVDFLHRTVRDFLNDCYYNQLQQEASPGFNPLISLCRIMLFLLKGLPTVNPTKPSSINQVISIVDELLYYAHEVEKRDPLPSAGSSSPFLVPLLDEVDAVNCRHAQALHNHWTHMRDPPATRGYDEYREGGNCSFLALTVQARLVKYVGAKLDSNPGLMDNKRGRPLLDYALRPKRVTPVTMPYHSQRDDSSIDIEMVRLLLDRGANPNQRVYLNEGRTVWELFLLSCYEAVQRDDVSKSLRLVWYRVSELLITKGAARLDAGRNSNSAQPIMAEILEKIFEKEAAQKLLALAEAEKLRAKSAKGMWYFVSIHGWQPWKWT